MCRRCTRRDTPDRERLSQFSIAVFERTISLSKIMKFLDRRILFSMMMMCRMEPKPICMEQPPGLAWEGKRPDIFMALPIARLCCLRLRRISEAKPKSRRTIGSQRSNGRTKTVPRLSAVRSVIRIFMRPASSMAKKP